MALTPSQRPTREWTLFLLTIVLVGLVVYPLWTNYADTDETWPSLPPERWAKLLLGPEQIACYCCFVWGLLIFLGRYREMRRQRRGFALGFLPTEDGARILPEDARPLQRALDQLTMAHGPFILANMIRAGLAKLGLSRSSLDVRETLNAQAEADLGRLITSMATMNYLAWAIPAIGFFGTVRGLAGSMTLAGQGGEQLRIATQHLTVAFDCTLVALGLSLVSMFFVHTLQREEESLVIDCQQFCLEHLVNRIYEPDVGTSVAGLENGTELAVSGMLAGGRDGEGRSMSVLAFDWNATRVRAVMGRAGETPLPMPLEPPSFELPLTIGLDQASAEVGAGALSRCRSAARQVCTGYLPHLGAVKRWETGRHSLDAQAACALVWRRLQPLASSARMIVLTVPGYLQPGQAETLRKLGEKARLPTLGSLSTILAAALAGRTEHFWQRSVLVIDADDHALTLGWVKVLAERAHLIETRSFTQLGIRAWQERQIDALSDRFIREHRRDPRDVPRAEQSIFNQLDALALAAVQHRPMQLGVDGQQWFKHLLVHPEQTLHFCRALAQQAAQEVGQLLTCWPASELPPAILLTHQASRLPGLIDAMQPLLAERVCSSSETILPPTRVTGIEEEDFGEDLLRGEMPPRNVMVLTPEAPARSAHALAPLFRNGTLPAGHLETIVPFGPAAPKRAGDVLGVGITPPAATRQA